MSDTATTSTPLTASQSVTQMQYLVQVESTSSPQPSPVPKMQLRIIRRLDSLTVDEDIAVIVRAADNDLDNFLASFEKAGIVASGDTPEDAMRHLCETIEMNFEFFSDNEASLGPGPKRQLAVLRDYLHK